MKRLELMPGIWIAKIKCRSQKTICSIFFFSFVPRPHRLANPIQIQVKIAFIRSNRCIEIHILIHVVYTHVVYNFYFLFFVNMSVKFDKDVINCSFYRVYKVKKWRTVSLTGTRNPRSASVTIQHLQRFVLLYTKGSKKPWDLKISADIQEWSKFKIYVDICFFRYS